MEMSLARRQAMVDGQIRPNNVTDERLITALLAVPREVFVPKALKGVAYVDEDILIGGGRYLMEPVVFARLLQAARIGPDDAVLDVGCGTGYSSAVLARLASAVVALEVDPELVRRANANLTELGVDNVAVVQGELREGCPAQGPYDVIFVNGAVEEAPVALTQQLGEDGRMLLVERRNGVGKAMSYGRFKGNISRRELFGAQVPTLPGFERKPAFVF